MQGNLKSSLKSLFNSLLCVLLFANARPHVQAQEIPSGSKAGESKQNENSASKKETANGTGKVSAEGVLPPPTTKYLLTPDKNELIPVPNDAEIEGYYKWLEEERNKPKGPLAYTMSEVDIDGVANDERATLTVTFTVRLQHADRFVRVPLYFNDAVLMPGYNYFGDGVEDIDGKDPKQGYVWWFKGKGPHRLKLVFSVPLQKPIPSRHLIVPLPISAISHMKMTLPYASVKPTVLPDKPIVEVKTAGAGKTTIEVSGLGSHLDLSWQPNVEVRPNEVSLESYTTILAQIEADQVMIRAHQKVTSLYGQFDHVSVTLPTVAELLTLEGPEKLSYEIDPEKRQQVLVTFREKVSSAQLNWTIRIPAKLKTPLTIDGFVVEESRNVVVKHVGIIGLSLAQGLQFSERRSSTFPAINQFLRGVHVSEFPSTIGTVDRAYKFISQPFKLVTAFDEVKPSFEVKPLLVLTASAQQLVLDAKFDFRVDRYSTNEVLLTWPNHKSEGWTIDNVQEPGVVESFESDDKGQIKVRLVKHFTGNFSVHLRAHRHFKSADDVTFSMPRPKSASRLLPSNLILVNAENVETDLSARGETVFHPLPSSSWESDSLPETAKDLKAVAYRVDTDEQSFGLRVMPQKQRIRTESFVETNWQDNQFRIVQHLIYHVEYERLNQVRLVVPRSIDLERCRFLGSKDVPLTPEQLPSSSGPGRLIQLKLGEPQLGKFEIQAVFWIQFSKKPTLDSSETVVLPFLESADDPFSQTRVSLVQSDWFDAEPKPIEIWKPQRNRLDTWDWVAEGEQAEIALKLVRSARSNEAGRVSRALVNITLDETGIGLVRAQYRVSTRAMLLPVQLPSTASGVTFSWDAKQLSNRECAESPAGSNRYIVEPQTSEAAGTAEHLLTIDYQENFGSSLGWSDKRNLHCPILLNYSWNQVLWQIMLPAGQHLLTYPKSAATLFHWQRTGLIWSRVSDLNSDWLQKWISENTEGAPESDEVLSEKNGNSYLFRQLDSPKPLVFHTLSSSMVLLMGAGFSLAVGFVMLRVVVVRHVLTLLILGLVVAIAGLWFAAPLELLLQPMIAGLMFPVAAVLLEGWIRKRYDNGVLSFERQDEFPPLQTFGSHFVVRQSDPNEATLHRPGNRDSESSLPIESGSGVS